MNKSKNALILGVSSGFGRAAATELAEMGYNIYGVHMDIGVNKKNAEVFAEELRVRGVKVVFYNTNAADDLKRKETIEAIKNEITDSDNPKINFFLHSIAFGAVGPLIHRDAEKQVTRRKMDMTMNVMANSLLYWTQDVLHQGMFAAQSRIIALTSAGSRGVMEGYGALSIAKCALEAYVRQLAVELAPYKITVNALMPGTTDTPAGRAIPGFAEMLIYSKKKNPYKRVTLPEDVAKILALLADERSYWINGQIIGADGGEDVVNYPVEKI
ncbi:MAG: SDR family oxidoreductase [Candidatus Kapabacteria bacterium]|jgi:enoyl-[acyl-carrier protein] reductase III|nr:SDR family oxidoreductase [Candidatus Kapabacteria bacterium]